MRFGTMSFLLLCIPFSTFAGEPGWFGFSVKTGITWAMNVESAVINGVAKESPADKAGIAVGDELTSIEGCRIPGCGAFKADGLLDKPVGGALRLELKKKTGETYSAVLTAVAEPKPSK